jgi:hypothetical protein
MVLKIKSFVVLTISHIFCLFHIILEGQDLKVGIIISCKEMLAILSIYSHFSHSGIMDVQWAFLHTNSLSLSISAT